jgi:hypothetical protein
MELDIAKSSAAQQAVAVDGAGRLELFCYLPLMRSGWPRRLASDRAATEPQTVGWLH